MINNDSNDSCIISGKKIIYSIGDKTLIDDISIDIKEGAFCSIVGPNGAGKTTLLNVLNGDIQPSSGVSYIAESNVKGFKSLELAHIRAVLPQLAHIPFVMNTFDIVAMGREPFRYVTEKHINDGIIQRCLEYMDISHLAGNKYSTLSGGEQHRVHIARTLAQIDNHEHDDFSGKILFLDEPTNHLDIRHQYALMKLLKKLQDKGLTIVSVMHDLSLTLQYADHIALLNDGAKVGDYSPKSLVEQDALSDVYQMAMIIKWDDEFERYIIIPNS